MSQMSRRGFAALFGGAAAGASSATAVQAQASIWSVALQAWRCGRAHLRRVARADLVVIGPRRTSPCARRLRCYAVRSNRNSVFA